MVMIDRDKLRTASDMARLSSHVYGGADALIPQGWKKLSDSAASISEKETGFFAALYERTDAQAGEARYAIAFRGTKNISDLPSDIDIALGQLPGQFGIALKYVESTCKSLGIQPEDMALTGHSLGGYLARTVGTALAVSKVWLFNSPGPTQETRDYLEKLIPSTALPNDKMIHFRSKYDIISHWGFDEGEIIEVKTRGDHHSLQNLSQQIARLENPILPDVRIGGRCLSLSSVFNAASKFLTQAKTLGASIKKLFTYGKPKKPAAPSFAPPSLGFRIAAFA
ncbi:MAG: hypothetical protein PW788_01540 [Micavibrio sp.]|nr:hypothetical protein [Micavibrio sp.]